MIRSAGQHHRLRRLAALALAGTLPAAAALATLQADNEPDNLVVQGGFDRAAVNLRLPAVSPFPLVAGGWGARGGDAATLRAVAVSGTTRALEILTSRDAAAHAIQDLPIGTRSWNLELSVQRLAGRQSLRLIAGWDRMDPDAAGDAITLVFGAGGLRVETAAGTWHVSSRLGPDRWARLRLVADSRDEQLHVWVDDRLEASLPGLTAAPPQTLVIGGHDGRGSSHYRYDDIRLFRLAELELATVRRDALRWMPQKDLPWLLDHLDAAAQVLGHGSEILAVPELRAAARLLEAAAAGTTDAPALESTRDSVDALLALVAGS